jgi:hypothetical protein
MKAFGNLQNSFRKECGWFEAFSWFVFLNLNSSLFFVEFLASTFDVVCMTSGFFFFFNFQDFFSAWEFYMKCNKFLKM